MDQLLKGSYCLVVVQSVSWNWEGRAERESEGGVGGEIVQIRIKIHTLPTPQQMQGVSLLCPYHNIFYSVPV